MSNNNLSLPAEIIDIIFTFAPRTAITISKKYSRYHSLVEPLDYKIYLACKYNNIDLINHYKLNTDFKYGEYVNVMHWAAAKGYIDICRLLPFQENSWRAVVDAAINKHYKIVDLLMQFDAYLTINIKKILHIHHAAVALMKYPMIFDANIMFVIKGKMNKLLLLLVQTYPKWHQDIANLLLSLGKVKAFRWLNSQSCINLYNKYSLTAAVSNRISFNYMWKYYNVENIEYVISNCYDGKVENAIRLVPMINPDHIKYLVRCVPKIIMYLSKNLLSKLDKSCIFHILQYSHLTRRLLEQDILDQKEQELAIKTAIRQPSINLLVNILERGNVELFSNQIIFDMCRNGRLKSVKKLLKYYVIPWWDYENTYETRFCDIKMKPSISRYVRKNGYKYK